MDLTDLILMDFCPEGNLSRRILLKKKNRPRSGGGGERDACEVGMWDYFITISWLNFSSLVRSKSSGRGRLAQGI